MTSKQPKPNMTVLVSGNRIAEIGKNLKIPYSANLLAGTDVSQNFPFVFFGFSLHEELELLVKAELSPFETLQTATTNPARFLDKEKDLGTIEKGKLADLVLLDANPLENITNTRKIAAVIANGKYLPKSELEKLLAQAEVLAKK